MARKREKTETKQGKGMARGEKERCGRGHAVLDECVSPIMFTQFHPSNKSFKTGIREKVKAKHRRDAERSQTNILYSTAANCFLQ